MLFYSFICYLLTLFHISVKGQNSCSSPCVSPYSSRLNKTFNFFSNVWKVLKNTSHTFRNCPFEETFFCYTLCYLSFRFLSDPYSFSLNQLFATFSSYIWNIYPLSGLSDSESEHTVPSNISISRFSSLLSLWYSRNDCLDSSTCFSSSSVKSLVDKKCAKSIKSWLIASGERVRVVVCSSLTNENQFRQFCRKMYTKCSNDGTHH